MKKSQIITILQGKFPHITLDQMESMVDVIMNAMTDALKNEKRIEIRGFGTLSTRRRNVQKSFPKDGEEIQLVEKKSIYFRMGKELFDRLNDEKE